MTISETKNGEEEEKDCLNKVVYFLRKLKMRKYSAAPTYIVDCLGGADNSFY